MSKLIDYPNNLPVPKRFIKAVAQRMQSSRIPETDLEIAFDYLKELVLLQYQKEAEAIDKQESRMMETDIFEED